MKLEARVRAFFDRLRSVSHRTLLLDYDGTIAPFSMDRTQAFPYPGIAERIARIAQTGATRIGFITGRSASELAGMLAEFGIRCEIWGEHGFEYLSAKGCKSQLSITAAAARGVEHASAILSAEGYDHALQRKCGSVALHWRGHDDTFRHRARRNAEVAFEICRAETSCRLLEFDGGLELVFTQSNKGDIVRKMLDGLPDGSAVAYLGDDMTDEDAFKALSGRGLSVLVRDEHRPTAADVWIKPPMGVMAFLDAWEECVSVKIGKVHGAKR